MHHQQLCLQTTVGNVICGMRHGHCVCVSHTMSRSSRFWLRFFERPTSKQHQWIVQVSRTKPETFSCQSNRLRYSVAGATKDAVGRLKCIHLRCSELSQGWRFSLGEKISDWEKRVFDIGIQRNKQYKQDNDEQ